MMTERERTAVKDLYRVTKLALRSFDSNWCIDWRAAAPRPHLYPFNRPHPYPFLPLFSVIQYEQPAAYTRSSSGKTKAEIQKLRTKFESAQVRRKAGQNQPFAFTPARYDEEYLNAMAKLETE
jgi:hypothetical protein